MAAKFADKAPRIMEQDDAHVWLFEDRIIPNAGTRAVSAPACGVLHGLGPLRPHAQVLLRNPRAQLYLEKQLGFLPPATIDKLTWKNAASLYQFDVPQNVLDGSWHREVTC